MHFCELAYVGLRNCCDWQQSLYQNVVPINVQLYNVCSLPTAAAKQREQWLQQAKARQEAQIDATHAFQPVTNRGRHGGYSAPVLLPCDVVSSVGSGHMRGVRPVYRWRQDVWRRCVRSIAQRGRAPQGGSPVEDKVINQHWPEMTFSRFGANESRLFVSVAWMWVLIVV